MSSNANEKSLNPSMLKKLTLERRISIDNIHPLSLIMMDVSPLITILNEIDNRQTRILSTITKILKDNTRKSDIKTCIHKSKYALFLPNTFETGAYKLSDRLYEKIKNVLVKHNFSFRKSDYILFQISTYHNTSQVENELEIINKQYRKTII